MCLKYFVMEKLMEEFAKESTGVLLVTELELQCIKRGDI